MGTKRINNFIHQNFRSGCPGSYADGLKVAQLCPIQIRRPLYKQRPRAAIFLTHFNQAF